MNGIIFGAGRLGRLHFLYWNIALTVAGAILIFLTTPDDVDGLADAVGNRFLGWLPILWLSCAAATRRAHDRNHSGWFVVLLFLPLVNIAATLYLLFAPSFDMPNRYGAPAGGQLKLSATELEQAKAILAAEEAEAARRRDEDLLNADGSFDMNGLFKHSPALVSDSAPAPTDSSLPAPPPPPPTSPSH